MSIRCGIVGLPNVGIRLDFGHSLYGGESPADAAQLAIDHGRLFGMDVNDNPDIEFPAATITVVQPGAAPTEMETQVTQRVEAAVRSLEGVEEIQSTVSEGGSGTFVQFTIETPVDRAVTDVRDAISAVRGQLPQEILEPLIQRFAPRDQPIVALAITSTRLTVPQLTQLADQQLGRELR